MTKAQYSKVTSKGQITIPHLIRDQMNLLSGSKLEFLNKGDHIVMLLLNKSVKNLKGILPAPETSLSCEEMNEIIRGDSK
jgi:antitoxin PrlF